MKTHGGKYYLSARLNEIASRAKHTKYLEAFCGGLNFLINKPCEGISEWANDLNGELINFWRVLRDTPDGLLRALLGTPMSQLEYLEAIKQHGKVTDELARARNFFVTNRMSRQGLGKDYATPTSRTRRGMNEHVSAWWGAIEGLPELHTRLSRVEIWQRPAIEAIRQLDDSDTLFYCDPPYMLETRSSTGEYGEHEMTREDHAELLLCLASVKGKFMLSGYHSDLYDQVAYLYEWNLHEIKIPNNASSKRSKEIKTECVWTNF